MEPLFPNAKSLIISLWENQPNFREWLSVICKHIKKNKDDVFELHYDYRNQSDKILSKQTLMLVFDQCSQTSNEVIFSSDHYLKGNTWFTTFCDKYSKYFVCHCMNPILLDKLHENINLSSGARGLGLRSMNVVDALLKNLNVEREAKTHFTSSPLSTEEVDKSDERFEIPHTQWIYIVQVSSLLHFYNEMTSNQ